MCSARAGPLRAVVSARYAALDGDGFRRDLEGQGAIFRARQRAITGFVDVRVSIGGGFSRYAPSGTIPASGMFGRIQPELVAPELALHAAAARASAASATVLAHLARGATLVVRGRFDRPGPVDSIPGVGAERSLWSSSAGVVWVGR